MFALFIAILLAEVLLVYGLVRKDPARAGSRDKVNALAQHLQHIFLAILPSFLLAVLIYLIWRSHF